MTAADLFLSTVRLKGYSDVMNDIGVVLKVDQDRKKQFPIVCESGIISVELNFWVEVYWIETRCLSAGWSLELELINPIN